VLSEILLTKLAHDAGFVVELGKDGNWLIFGVPGYDLRVWLRSAAEGAVVAISRESILKELTTGRPWAGQLPRGASGALEESSPDLVVATLNRARILDRTLPQALLIQYQAAVTKLDSTEAQAIAKQRRGQDIFRRGLLDYWQGRCAITGLAIPELLRASHAKPWKDSSDAERLDVYNGLLLAAHLDAAFDQGFLTLGGDGAILLSRELATEARNILGLGQLPPVTTLKPEHAPYLAWHREHVYRK
jgi:putative restriction endonuclease